MNTWDKIRIKYKIKKIVKMMRKKMTYEDRTHSAQTIKTALHKLPFDRKEDFLDVCIQVLKETK